MLVLSRMVNEKLIITVPPSSQVQLTEVCSMRKARIGIQANREVMVMRQELLPRSPTEATGS